MANPPFPNDAGVPIGAVTEFDRMVVTATRTERAIADVPNTVDVIDRERMDDILARDLKDLFRYEPGITTTSSFGRFGIGDIRIRGLEGNRVRIQTDGIPVPDAFLIGSFSNANRNFVDLDTLKRVEVVRGPTSSLYGSDALGGVVSFITKDPSDYLEEGRDAYFGLRFGHEGNWDGLTAGATAAFGGDRWSGMAVVSHRQGQETENMGETGGEGAARTKPNPQQRDGRSLLAKLVFAPSDTQRFRLTVEGNEDSADTDVLTSRGLQPLTGAVNSLVTGDDHQTRARLSLAHEMDALDAGFADRLDWQVYRQDSETTQDTVEVRRTAAGVNERRDREFNFDQRLQGVQANLHKDFATGTVRHALAYGLDVSRTETRQKRDGRVHNLDTGAVSNAMLPDVFPVRDFPISTTTNAALYVQDEIAFAGDSFRLVPAVRVDHYRLRPQVDAIFAEDNPGVAVANLSETSVSPKLGAVWHFAGDWSLFGGYCARLPLAAVQRRQHRVHQPDVRLHRDRQSGPEARNQQWHRTGHALRRRCGLCQPVRLRQPLSRLHRIVCVRRVQRRRPDGVPVAERLRCAHPRRRAQGRSRPRCAVRCDDGLDAARFRGPCARRQPYRRRAAGIDRSAHRHARRRLRQ